MVRTSLRKLNNRATNVFAPVAIRRQRESKSTLRMSAALLTAALLAACAPQPAPRSASDFMEDGYAREGVLSRCNRDRDASLTDAECANARRAAAALALEGERAREADLERASQAKLLAMRARDAGQGAAAETTSVPAFGTPVGAVMPSMSQAFDVYADGTQPLGRPALEVEQVAPPSNDLEIASPQLALTDLEIVPRPFRADDTAQP
jgi:hypothetical protein